MHAANKYYSKEKRCEINTNKHGSDTTYVEKGIIRDDDDDNDNARGKIDPAIDNSTGIPG